MKRDLPTPTRMKIRGVVRGALGVVPRRALEPLRHAYPRAPEGSVRRRLLGAALSVVRLRAITGVDTFRLSDAPDLQLANVDSQIVQLVYWLGQSGYEPGEAQWWRKACSQAQRILELGANIGYYTVQGASAARDIPYVAVDPLPVNVDALRRNLALNSLDNVEIVEAAVVGDDGPATVELMLPDLHPYATQTGAYVAGAAVGDRPASHSVTVPTIPMRDLLNGVDLLKIDIEGFEHEVLAPVRAELVSRTPVLFIEVLNDAVELRGFLADLVDEGVYGIWALTDEGAAPVSTSELRARGVKTAYGTRDVILAPPSRAVALGLESG